MCYMDRWTMQSRLSANYKVKKCSLSATVHCRVLQPLTSCSWCCARASDQISAYTARASDSFDPCGSARHDRTRGEVASGPYATKDGAECQSWEGGRGLTGVSCLAATLVANDERHRLAPLLMEEDEALVGTTALGTAAAAEKAEHAEAAKAAEE